MSFPNRTLANPFRLATKSNETSSATGAVVVVVAAEGSPLGWWCHGESGEQLCSSASKIKYSPHPYMFSFCI